MIHRLHRFHGHGSLRFVYQKGQIVQSPFLSLKYVLNQRRDTYRVAVVVSRKVSKSAVVRNRIRRRIYEIVRKHEAGITQAYDLVFLVYDEAVAGLAPAQLQAAVLGQLQKARIVERLRPAAPPNHDIVVPKGGG